MLDQYCERTADGLLAEPLNAVTNVAFLVAAMAAAPRVGGAAGPRGRSWDLWLLLVLVAAIGAGSAAWHTLATRWALLADVVPILLFVNVFLLSFLVRVAGMPLWAVAATFAAWQVLDRLVQRSAPAGALNGSLFYLPALLALTAAAGWAARKHRAGARRLLLACVLFAGSVLLRTIDQAVCGLVPTGTHFLWHLLNALVLYLLLTALAASTLPAGRSRLRGP